MAEKIDQLEDALVEIGTKETIKALDFCNDIYNELVRHELLVERRNERTGALIERKIMGHIGTLGAWKERVEELKDEVGDPLPGGAGGSVIRLLLFILIPIALWVVPPIRSFLSQPMPFFVFNLLIITGIPIICFWALSTAKALLPFPLVLLLPIALFVGLLVYQRHLEQQVQGRLPFPELFVIFTVFYVLLFLLRFRLTRDVWNLFSQEDRERRALCQQAHRRLAALEQKVDLAIGRPDGEYRITFCWPSADGPAATRESFQYVKKYYSSLHTFFK